MSLPSGSVYAFSSQTVLKVGGPTGNNESYCDCYLFITGTLNKPRHSHPLGGAIVSDNNQQCPEEDLSPPQTAGEHKRVFAGGADFPRF